MGRTSSCGRPRGAVEGLPRPTPADPVARWTEPPRGTCLDSGADCPATVQLPPADGCRWVPESRAEPRVLVAGGGSERQATAGCPVERLRHTSRISLGKRHVLPEVSSNCPTRGPRTWPRGVFIGIPVTRPVGERGSRTSARGSAYAAASYRVPVFACAAKSASRASRPSAFSSRSSIAYRVAIEIVRCPVILITIV
jgi:hypothetical protein